MPAGHVNRSVLSFFYQNAGDTYDDTKTEGAFETVAQQVDDNYDANQTHKLAAVLDHPDGSVTTAKIANGAVTAAKLDSALLENVTVAFLAAEFDAHVAEYTNMISARNGMNANAIINGNFDIWQRGTSFTNPANLTYAADRWKVEYSLDGGVLPTTITHSRQVITPGLIDKSSFKYRIAVDGSGSGFGPGAYYQIVQYIENGTRYLCGDGKKVTVSFKVESNISGKKIGVYLAQNYGSGGSASAGEIINGANFTLSAGVNEITHTFTTNTLTGKTFGTNNDDALSIRIIEIWGSGTYATVVGATSAETFVGAGNIDIAQVQLCAGDTALPFQPRSFGEELALCQRYYEKSYPLSTVPGLQSDNIVGAGIAFNTIIINSMVQYKVRKRIVTPTVTIYAYDGTSKRVSNYGATGNLATTNDVEALKKSEAGFNGLIIVSGATNFTAGNHYWFSWVSDAEL